MSGQIKLLFFGLLFGVFVSCSGPVRSEKSDLLPTIPKVITDGFQPTVAEQIERAQVALEAEPKNPEANANLGMILQIWGLSRAAVDCYERARQLDSSSARWPYYQAYALANLGEVARAVEALQKVLELRPDHLGARFKLARLLLELGELEESEGLYRLLVEENPKRPEAYFGLGRLLLRKEESEEAIEQFLSALEVGGEFGEIHLGFASAYRRMGQPGKAEEHAQRQQAYAGVVLPGAAAFPPEIFDELERRLGTPGDIAEGDELDKFRAAIASFEERLGLDPEDGQAHASLMVLNGRMGQIGKGLEHYEKARSTLDSDPTLHLSAGNLLLIAEDYQGAAQAFQKALDIAPQYLDAHLQLGQAFDRMNQGVFAIRQYRIVIGLAPGQAIARGLLGRRLAIAGDFEAALSFAPGPEPQHPSQTPWVFLARAGVQVGQGNPSEAETLLASARQGATETLDPQLLLAVEQKWGDLKMRDRVNR